jgi:acyl-CoA synthetase (AMP-forming)/AMP-acid ligase II
MQEYVTQNEMTEAVKQGGFFPTGDVGCVNEQGFAFLVNRLKELIKVKGHVSLRDVH